MRKNSHQPRLTLEKNVSKQNIQNYNINTLRVTRQPSG